jgi:hypothetical protein
VPVLYMLLGVLKIMGVLVKIYVYQYARNFYYTKMQAEVARECICVVCVCVCVCIYIYICAPKCLQRAHAPKF